MTESFIIKSTDTTCSTWNGTITTDITTSPWCSGVYNPYPPSRSTTIGDIIEDIKKAVIESMVKNSPCEYCGSHCVDMRGNCGACGAPL